MAHITALAGFLLFQLALADDSIIQLSLTVSTCPGCGLSPSSTNNVKASVSSHLIEVQCTMFNVHIGV